MENVLFSCEPMIVTHILHQLAISEADALNTEKNKNKKMNQAQEFEYL